MRPALPPLAFLLLLAGCGTSGHDDALPGCSAARIDYDGASFIGNGVGIEPVAGGSLGEGTFPPCEDSVGYGRVPERPVTVRAVDGVSPKVAILILQKDRTGTVFIRRDVQQADMPAALRRLLKAPACDPAAEPIQLAGPWLGITHPRPPYSVQLYVASTPSERYERAYLKVHVPASRELSEADIAAFVTEAGATIDITAHCAGKKFVADRIATHAVGKVGKH